jgi:hypothetical protein
VGTVGQRHLVVGRVDGIHAHQLRGQVEVPIGVEELGLDRAVEYHRRRRVHPPNRGDVGGDPVGVYAHDRHR